MSTFPTVQDILSSFILVFSSKNGGQKKESERPLRSGIGHCVCFHSNGHLVLSASVNMSMYGVGEGGMMMREGRDNGLYCKWFSIWNKTRFFRPSLSYYTVGKTNDF